MWNTPSPRRMRRPNACGGSTGRAVYIGDSGFDMQCARSAGVKSVLALWGTHEPELEADLRLGHPGEILTLSI